MKSLLQRLIKTVVFATIIAAIIMLTGCVKYMRPSDVFSTDNKEALLNRNITLTIEVGQDALLTFPTTFCQSNLDAFEDQYPYITIKILEIPEKQIKTTLQTKLISGTPSDIICYNKVSAETELNASKYFLDLTDEPWVERLVNANVLTASDGKIYGYAMQNFPHGLGIVYNKDIFEELDLSVPKSYKELTELCSTIKEHKIIPIYAPFGDLWTFQIWTTSAWGYVAEKVRPGLWNQLNTGEIAWSDIPEFKEILERAYELYQNGYMQKTILTDDYISAVDAFGNRECAMMFGTSDFITLMKSKYPNLNLDLFPVQPFDYENNYITQAQLGGVLFIPKASQHLEEAKLFLDFLSQVEQVERAAAEAPFLPMVKDANVPQLTDFQQTLVDTYIQPGYTCIEMNCYMKVPLDDLWKYFNEMYMGIKTPEQVLDAWNERFSYLMHEIGESGF